MAKRIEIVNGPSINALVLWILEPTVRDGGTFTRRHVNFVTKESKQEFFDFVIYGIKLEDGSGKRWFIDGHASRREANGHWVTAQYHAYFDFDSRKGWLEYAD